MARHGIDDLGQSGAASAAETRRLRGESPIGRRPAVAILNCHFGPHDTAGPSQRIAIASARPVNQVGGFQRPRNIKKRRRRREFRGEIERIDAADGAADGGQSNRRQRRGRCNRKLCPTKMSLSLSLFLFCSRKSRKTQQWRNGQGK